MEVKVPIYGLVAEFPNITTLTHAAHAAYQAGYRRMDAYTPFPSEELTEALGVRQTRLPFLVLAGGVLGAVGGYALQYYSMALAYPNLNVGGRHPGESWPAFVPVMFEVTVLCAALVAVLGMLALNRLPQPYHPLFHVERFSLATGDRFFLCIEAADPKFDLERTRAFLLSLAPMECTEVPR